MLVHGSYYVDGAESAVRTPACIKWFKILPMPWYFEKDRMQVACTNSTAELDSLESVPPVVVARASHAEELDQRLGDDYRKETVLIRQDAISTVVYIERSAPRADVERSAPRADVQRSAPRADIAVPGDTHEAVHDARAAQARLRAAG